MMIPVAHTKWSQSYARIELQETIQKSFLSAQITPQYAPTAIRNAHTLIKHAAQMCCHRSSAAKVEVAVTSASQT